MPEFTYTEYRDRIRTRSFAPVILLYGEEDLLLDECIEDLISNSLDEAARSFDLDVVDGSRAEIRDVLTLVASYPMMSERRVVIVRDAEKLLSEQPALERFLDYLRRPVDTTVFLLTVGKLDRRLKLFKALQETADVVAFPRLYDNQVPDWIASRFEKAGRHAEDEACRLLQAYAGNGLRTVDQEIQKLLLFVGDRKEITVEDVGAAVGASRGYTVFDLQNAIGRRDLAEATRILKRMLEMGEYPSLIVSLLSRYFMTLWKVAELKQKRASDSQIASELRMKPFQLRQMLQCAGRFTPEEIERAFDVLYSTDLQLKTSAIDPHVGLDVLVYSLIKSPSPVSTTRR